MARLPISFACGGDKVTSASEMSGCSKSFAVIFETQEPQLMPVRGKMCDDFMAWQ
jgi:hypothetical protein